MAIKNYSVNIPKGISFIRAFESSESDPVIGSRQELNDPRTGSPFTIQVLLPDILANSLSHGGKVSVPKGIFDPLLEQLNRENVLIGQSELGTRVPTSINIGIVDAALRSSNNFSKVRSRQEKVRQSSFVSNSEGLRNLQKVVYGNGQSLDPSAVGLSSANQMALSDLNQALSVILQANQILNCPVLQLLVNPASLTFTYNKKQDYSQQTRHGFVVQSWGEDQPRIAVSGKIGAFIASSPEGGTEDGRTVSVSGAQWNSREDSAAFQNLMDLFMIYQSNALIYDILGQSVAHQWVGDILISYDQKQYLGNFETFSYTYEETRPNGGLEYSFQFTVSREYDTHSFGPILPIENTGTSVFSGSDMLASQENSSDSILNPLIG